MLLVSLLTLQTCRPTLANGACNTCWWGCLYDNVHFGVPALLQVAAFCVRKHLHLLQVDASQVLVHDGEVCAWGCPACLCVPMRLSR